MTKAGLCCPWLSLLPILPAEQGSSQDTLLLPCACSPDQGQKGKK